LSWVAWEDKENVQSRKQHRSCWVFTDFRKNSYSVVLYLRSLAKQNLKSWVSFLASLSESKWDHEEQSMPRKKIWPNRNGAKYAWGLQFIPALWMCLPRKEAMSGSIQPLTQLQVMNGLYLTLIVL
jgi:hypothetical protein